MKSHGRLQSRERKSKAKASLNPQDLPERGGKNTQAKNLICIGNSSQFGLAAKRGGKNGGEKHPDKQHWVMEKKEGGVKGLS